MIKNFSRSSVAPAVISCSMSTVTVVCIYTYSYVCVCGRRCRIVQAECDWSIVTFLEWFLLPPPPPWLSTSSLLPPLSALPWVQASWSRYHLVPLSFTSLQPPAIYFTVHLSFMFFHLFIHLSACLCLRRCLWISRTSYSHTLSRCNTISPAHGRPLLMVQWFPLWSSCGVTRTTDFFLLFLSDTHRNVSFSAYLSVESGATHV